MSVLTRGLAWANPVPSVTDRPSDLELVRAVVRGDDGAFGQLRERTERIVASCLARALARHPDVAMDREDLLQSFYLFLLENDGRVLGTYSGRASLTTWMHSVAIRYFYRQTSRRKAKANASPDADATLRLPSLAPTPEEAAHCHARIGGVREALEALPDDERAMLRLLYEQEVSATAAGQVLSMSGAAVRMKKKRLLARLAAKLEDLRL